LLRTRAMRVFLFYFLTHARTRYGGSSEAGATGGYDDEDDSTQRRMTNKTQNGNRQQQIPSSPAIVTKKVAYILPLHKRNSLMQIT